MLDHCLKISPIFSQMMGLTLKPRMTSSMIHRFVYVGSTNNHNVMVEFLHDLHFVWYTRFVNTRLIFGRHVWKINSIEIIMARIYVWTLFKLISYFVANVVINFQDAYDHFYDMKISTPGPMTVGTVFHTNRTYVDSNSDISYM